MRKQIHGPSWQESDFAVQLFIGLVAFFTTLATTSRIREEVLIVTGVAVIVLSALIMVVQRLLSTHAANIETLKDQVTLAYIQALESSGINPALAKNKLHA